MNTIKGNKREIAMKWWNNLTFEEKWFAIIRFKDSVTGYPDRSPHSLTGREIENLYHLQLFTL